MALASLLRRALAARNLALVALPPSAAEVTTYLLNRLAEDSADGRAFRYFVGALMIEDRPIIERFKGNEATLSVEGPIYCCGGFGFPLGGSIETGDGWIDCLPHEVNELADRLRDAIDTVLLDWAQRAQFEQRLSATRPARNRPIDDHLAKASIMDVVAASAAPMRHGEQVADDI